MQVHVGVDGGGSHVVGLEWRLLLIAVKLVECSPHSVIDPSSLGVLSLTRLVATKCPLASSCQSFVSFSRHPLLVHSSQPLEFLDNKHTATVPDMPEKGDHFPSIGFLKLEELSYLHCIYGRTWLTRVPLDNELSKVSHLQEIKMLKVCPPALQGAGDDVADYESKFQLALCLKFPLVRTWVSCDGITTSPCMSERGSYPCLRQHQYVQPLPLVWALEYVFEDCLLHCPNIAGEHLLKDSLHVIAVAL